MAESTAPPAEPPTGEQGSTAIFLVLRRMRAPLIVLVATFSVGVGGLMLMPGLDAEGKPWRMDVFEAFYFMSYTASTIGYGEIPHPFTPQQRLWVTISIYLTVIAWAYAIGTVFALLQDRGFRAALASQRFTRAVARMREPFLLVVGFGQSGQLVGKALDEMDRRFVVVDNDQARIDALDLAQFRSDVPGHAGDARNPDELIRAGLGSRDCEGVIALTDDDEANLAVVMTAALLRPELQVVARTMEQEIADRMAEFGDPMIVDPFNLFGDELMLAVKRPQTYRLIQWLTSSHRETMPPPPPAPRDGRWVVCGYGRFGSHLVADLIRHGVRVTVIDPQIAVPASSGVEGLSGSGTDPDVLAGARLGEAVGFAAATDNDTSNLSLITAVRNANPELFLVARQNQPVNAPLFDALGIDSVLVPTNLIAHEVTARIGSPLLWRFVQQARLESDAWSTAVLHRLSGSCGQYRPDLWRVGMDSEGAPAARAWLADGDAALGDLLLDPTDRDRPLDAVVLLVVRGAEAVVTPPDDFRLHPGDQLLLAGTAAARRGLDTTLGVPAALQYVVSGRRVANSWIWRTLVDRS